MKFVVLGGYGIIGKIVVEDLFKTCKNCEIIVAGRDFAKVKAYASSFKSNRIKAKEIDINNENQLVNLIKNSDVVVNCLQYYFNVQIMKSCLKAKTNYVDLGGLFHETKKQLKLNNEFKKIGKLAIIGCGGAPGITNVLATYGSKFVKKISSVEITFADADYTKYNQEFVLPYSFKTIADEFSLKPAVFKNGKTTFAEPQSGRKTYDFGSEFGKQEGFYSLHSEIATIPKSVDKGIKNCEFRVTFPQDFINKINVLIENGFASKENLKFNGKDISTIDITSELMNRLLPKQGTEIDDREMLRVIINDKMTIDAITKSDGKNSAGVLDTAVPCSIAAQMIAKNEIKGTGVLPPEKAINYSLFFKELRKRKITIIKNGRIIN